MRAACVALASKLGLGHFNECPIKIIWASGRLKWHVIYYMCVSRTVRSPELYCGIFSSNIAVKVHKLQKMGGPVGYGWLSNPKVFGLEWQLLLGLVKMINRRFHRPHRASTHAARLPYLGIKVSMVPVSIMAELCSVQRDGIKQNSGVDDITFPLCRCGFNPISCWN